MICYALNVIDSNKHIFMTYMYNRIYFDRFICKFLFIQRVVEAAVLRYLLIKYMQHTTHMLFNNLSKNTHLFIFLVSFSAINCDCKVNFRTQPVQI